MPHDIISHGLTNRMPILQRVLSGKLFAPSALRAVPRTRVGFRSWRFCVVLKADNLVQNNTPADAEANLDSSDYVFIDLRKADDYKAGHIKGAIAADMDACKGGDFQNGVNTMKAALKDATGSESGGGK